MMCVMLFHQCFLSGRVWELFHQCGHWGVDVFLVVSGFGIASSLSKNSRETYFIHRINRLVPSCILFGLIYTYFSIVVFHAAVLRRLYFMLPFSLEHWYIFAIVCYYLLAPYICQILNRHKIGLLCCVVMLSYMMLYIKTKSDVSIIWPLDWTIERFPAFCFGMIIFYLGKWKLNMRYWVISAILACLLAYLMMFKINMFGSRTYCNQIFMLLIPAFCVFCGLLEKTTDFLRISNVFKWLGKYSLQIYLAHELCFKLVKKYIIVPPPEMQFIIAILLSILYAYMAYFLVGKMKILKR